MICPDLVSAEHDDAGIWLVLECQARIRAGMTAEMMTCRYRPRSAARWIADTVADAEERPCRCSRYEREGLKYETHDTVRRPRVWAQ